MDLDLAWVNGKSGRQSWRYHADAFQRSIISEAIYHLPFRPNTANVGLNVVRYCSDIYKNNKLSQ